jgi:hypothetical protein
MRISLAHITRHPIRLLGLTLAVLLLSLAPGHAASGATVYIAPGTIADDCSVDVTGPLLTWIASIPDNSVLAFSNGGCYRIEGTLELTNRHRLTFEGNGATFKATSAGDSHRSQWRLVEGSHFVFRNMTIDGGDAHGGTFEYALQWAHGIDLVGPSDVEIDHVNISNVYGDCVYLGLGWYSKAWTSNVHIHDSNCSRSGRMGVAVTAGRDVLVERTSFAEIGLAAFDIEPNGVQFGARRIAFTNNRVVTSNAVRPTELFDIVGDGPVDSVTISDNTVTGQGTHMTIIALPGQRRSNIAITGNTNDAPYSRDSSAIAVVGVDGLTIARNVFPLGVPSMALADVSQSCNINISGNAFQGGAAEARIRPYGGSCPAPSSSSRHPLTAPSPQTLSAVRRHGLLIRFRGDAWATWALTATLRKAAKLPASRLRAAHGTLARISIRARTGTGTVRLRIPRADLAGMSAAVIEVRAPVSSGGRSVLRSIVIRVTSGAAVKARHP